MLGSNFRSLLSINNCIQSVHSTRPACNLSCCKSNSPCIAQHVLRSSNRQDACDNDSDRKRFTTHEDVFDVLNGWELFPVTDAHVHINSTQHHLGLSTILDSAPFLTQHHLRLCIKFDSTVRSMRVRSKDRPYLQDSRWQRDCANC